MSRKEVEITSRRPVYKGRTQETHRAAIMRADGGDALGAMLFMPAADLERLGIDTENVSYVQFGVRDRELLIWRADGRHTGHTTYSAWPE